MARAASNPDQAAERGPHAPAPAREHAHGQGHHGHGNDPGMMARLDEASRDAWQRPEQVLAALGLKGSETVYDLGAGTGYFAVRLAAALPQGRVLAGDPDPAMVEHLSRRAATLGLTNLQARVIPGHDPSVPPGVDWVLVCNVLHHVTTPDVWLERLAAALPPGGRVALIDFREGPLPLGPPESMRIPRAILAGLVRNAGLTVLARHDELLPHQIFWILGRAGPPAPDPGQN